MDKYYVQYYDEHERGMERLSMKVKVDISKVDERYRSLVKPEMNGEELAIFGTVILKDKIANIKYWFRKNILYVIIFIFLSISVAISFLMNTTGLFSLAILLLGLLFIMKYAERSVENETKTKGREDN